MRSRLDPERWWNFPGEGSRRDRVPPCPISRQTLNRSRRVLTLLSSPFSYTVHRCVVVVLRMERLPRRSVFGRSILIRVTVRSYHTCGGPSPTVVSVTNDVLRVWSQLLKVRQGV